ncbi:MAG: hypothetical protein WCA35_00870, partial [Kovacikia sp.]
MNFEFLALTTPYPLLTLTLLTLTLLTLPISPPHNSPMHQTFDAALGINLLHANQAGADHN